MINIKNLYTDTIFGPDITLCAHFIHLIDEVDKMELICNTDLMYHVNSMLFDRKKILAYKLYLNSLYESLGGKLMQEFVLNNVQDSALKDDVLRQVKDEYRHGQMFASLIQYTGYNIEEIKQNIDATAFENEEFPFFKNVIDAMCFIHVAEVRTIILLDQFCKIINSKDDLELSKMLMILHSINKDEISHARYTGIYINNWIRDGNIEVNEAFLRCFVQINKEGWEEIAKLASIFSQYSTSN